MYLIASIIPFIIVEISLEVNFSPLFFLSLMTFDNRPPSRSSIEIKMLSCVSIILLNFTMFGWSRLYKSRPSSLISSKFELSSTDLFITLNRHFWVLFYLHRYFTTRAQIYSFKDSPKSTFSQLLSKLKVLILLEIFELVFLNFFH